MQKILLYNFNHKSVNNVHTGFIEAGYEVRNYTCEQYKISDAELEAQLNGLLDDFKPHVVFSYGWWKGRLNIDTFGEIIRQNGAFHVFWAFDDPDCFDNISLPAGKNTHIVFTTVQECIEKYRNHGVDAYLMLHGCNPLEHKYIKAKKNKYFYDAVLLANNYNVKWNPEYFGYRLNGIEHLVKPLAESDYIFKVWGHYWDTPDRIYNLPPSNYCGVAPYGNESRIYSLSKIALGLQSVGCSKTHFSVRTFEAMACRAFHLSQYSPALETYFKKGIHMEWTKSAEETLEIVDFYLKNEGARKRVALQGQIEVYANHTLKHRAVSAMEIINRFL